MAEEVQTRMELELCAPERTSVHFTADEVVLPGAAGVFTVEIGHTPLLSTLEEGVLGIYSGTEGEEEHFIAVHGGFAEVLDDRILVLTPNYETGDEIDVDRARASLDRAEERLRSNDEAINNARAESAFRRAMARIRANNREPI